VYRVGECNGRTIREWERGDWHIERTEGISVHGQGLQNTGAEAWLKEEKVWCRDFLGRGVQRGRDYRTSVLRMK